MDLFILGSHVSGFFLLSSWRLVFHLSACGYFLCGLGGVGRSFPVSRRSRRRERVLVLPFPEVSSLVHIRGMVPACRQACPPIKRGKPTLCFLGNWRWIRIILSHQCSISILLHTIKHPEIKLVILDDTSSSTLPAWLFLTLNLMGLFCILSLIVKLNGIFACWEGAIFLFCGLNVVMVVISHLQYLCDSEYGQEAREYKTMW